MGKGKKGKGGKPFKFGGLGFAEFSGPILTEPPLYPIEKMRHLVPVENVTSKDDIDLITNHRHLMAAWKTSPCFQDMEENRSYLQRKTAQEDDLDNKMFEITHSGGTGPAFFPAELLLKKQLKVKGKATAVSIMEALKRIEGKEAKAAQKKDPNSKDDVEGKEDEIDPLMDDDDDDEVFGDDDDIANYCDFETGEGNDFDDDGGGGGGDDF